MTTGYSIISENDESTVVAEYVTDPNLREDSGYQTEAELERDLIERLQKQGYQYAKIHSEEELIANLRAQIEKLNGLKFTDGEWERFFATEIAAENKGIVEKTETIQNDNIKTLKLDNGESRNITLIDKENPHANSLQVINQYVPSGGARENRYDVTILVNGLPLVHIELKRRGVDIKQAFNQINRYGRETFWAGCGLFDYVQIFVISNGRITKYYSNTTRDGHIREQNKAAKNVKARTSNSFEFTNFWADAKNKTIEDLTDFTATFFSRHTLLNILTRYCVFTEQKLLLVMRPYQIAAAERLINKVEIAHNNKSFGTTDAGGYIWHTTGSGKTLTSFKAAQLATKLRFIGKVLFVVDRKDLDYQTMCEYDRFQRGAANGNTSTKELIRQMNDAKSKIIITTIQKLTNYVKQSKAGEIYDKEVVIIFDECHRSQFGDMHAAITKKFKKYYIFGFTGTPIFSENKTGTGSIIRTTETVFGTCIHTYTIVDAIRDRNVLPFRIAYIRTMKAKEQIENSKVWDIDRDKALKAPERIENITKYILENFSRQTKRAERYEFSKLVNVEEIIEARGRGRNAKEERQKILLYGFNSIFAVQSIECARFYYSEFKKQNALLPPNKRLKIATIFSFAPNEDPLQGMPDEENSDSTEGLDQSSRDFLESAIEDYNAMFKTSFDTSTEKFPNYYKDVSLRMKNRELDLLIVVNMFLTGFDATTLNTLWVDKNLKYHGLIQAFSRTNRILNSVKVAGNIVCFRNLEEETNDALSLFGDKDARGTSILRKFEDYFYGYTDKNGQHVKGYVDYVTQLQEEYNPAETPVGEENQRKFILLFSAVLRMENLLSCFEQFATEKDKLLSERDRQDFTSIYIDLWNNRPTVIRPEPEVINDDLVFEMELVKQIEANVDYILNLVAIYHQKHCKDKDLLVKIEKTIDASPDLRDKKELIMQFMKSLTPGGDTYERWKAYVNEQKRAEFEKIIEEENLKRGPALEFIKRAFERGFVPEVGTDLTKILPPSVNPLKKSSNTKSQLQKILERIKAFFTKFSDVADD
ncbi:MAG: type I restriction endonuclease subunit R, partial [Oscillospiraceae bacterium]|nr:type I restriction endonuclease subunit R [Oscillospiraceae bacterium]